MTGMPSYPIGPESTAWEGGSALRLAPPAEVLTSVKLWFASILLGLLGGVLVFALTDQGAQAQTMRDAGTSGLTDAQPQWAVTILLVVVLVITVIVLALQIFFVLKMKAGRNWARIVLTVLAGLSAPWTLAAFAQGFDIGTAVNTISLALLIGAVVFMFRPAANVYFSQRRA